jgi:V/A-type H+-transporting ATPase subunit D
MSAIKLTKNELRGQQRLLLQLSHYLPTLQLKKALLQYEVNNTQIELNALSEEFLRARSSVDAFSPFLLEKVTFDIMQLIEVQHVRKSYENIAGIEIPAFEAVDFKEPHYFLFDTPVWTESAVNLVRTLVIAREKMNVVKEKMRALRAELSEVSIRVNLFEKILIPRSIENIRKIRIFLGDMQLTAIAQAKVAKAKIFSRKEKA